MKRKWIVALRLESSDLQVPACKPEIVDGFRKAIEQLESKVKGELAFALVPNEVVARLLEQVEFERPLHLVVPRESFSGTSTAKGDWSSLMKLAASTNVQPGRGETTEDWDDCEAWLESISEIDLVIQNGTGENRDPDEGVTQKISSVLFDLETGEATVVGFPDKGPMKDWVFDQVVRDLWGKKESPDDVEQIMEDAGKVTGRCAPWFRFLESGSLFLNISPSLILALAAALLWNPETTAVWKFSVAFLATLSALGLDQVRSRRRWLNARMVAEVCRSIRHSGEILDPLFPPAATHLPKHQSIARSLTLTQAEAGRALEIDASAIRDTYLVDRLRGEHGQLNYFSRQAVKAGRRRWRVRVVFHSSTILALAATLVALFICVGWVDIPAEINKRWISGFATLAFPALAAAAIGYLGLSETIRRADYYVEVLRLLEKQCEILEALKSESSIMEAIRKTENLLLEEFSGWLRRRVY